MSTLEPLSPEERAGMRGYACSGYAVSGDDVLRLLAERDSLADRVFSLEAEWVAEFSCAEHFARWLEAERAEFVALREKAQEVRRAWDAMGEAGDRLSTITGGGRAEAEQEYSDLFDEVRAAIDALVPPVAPPENAKEARS